MEIFNFEFFGGGVPSFQMFFVVQQLWYMNEYLKDLCLGCTLSLPFYFLSCYCSYEAKGRSFFCHVQSLKEENNCSSEKLHLTILKLFSCHLHSDHHPGGQDGEAARHERSRQRAVVLGQVAGRYSQGAGSQEGGDCQCRQPPPGWHPTTAGG